MKKRDDKLLVYVIDEACVSMVNLERETAAKRIILQGAEFVSLQDLLDNKISFENQTGKVTEMERTRMVFLQLGDENELTPKIAHNN